MYRENCGDKLDAFLSSTYYLNGGYNNKEGMAMLNARMEQVEVRLWSFGDWYFDTMIILEFI